MEVHFSITNTTQGKLPRLPFEDMKNEVLGSRYDLSLTIVSKAEIKKINLKHRNQNKVTDILSFPLSQNAGEIFINLEETKRASKDFNRPYENFLAYLFIHGLVHLKGLDHGAIMEKEEIRYRKKFEI